MNSIDPNPYRPSGPIETSSQGSPLDRARGPQQGPSRVGGVEPPYSPRQIRIKLALTVILVGPLVVLFLMFFLWPFVFWVGV